MNYQQDWILQQIESMATFIINIILGEKNESNESIEIENLKEDYLKSSFLYRKLNDLIAKKKICEAEDKLFRAIENNEEDTFLVSVLFYTEINKLSDEELKESNFSRGEISSGLEDVCKIYGVPLPLIYK